MEYRRRTVAGNEWGLRPRLRGRRLSSVATASCPNGVDQLDYDCDDDDDNVNNNSCRTSAAASVNMNDTTMLVDELEQLRTDNFQLRLRVYNAERRVDRLSASVARSHGRDDSSSGSESGSSSGSASDDENARALAAAKATAGAAVRTVHDLLTVNRRLLALLAAAVSAKAVAVTADDKRRWQKLRNRVDDCAAVDPPKIEEDEELENGDNDGDESVTSEDSETRTTARRRDAPEERATKTTTRHVPLRSPPPPEPDVPNDNNDASGGNGSELVRLRARCRRLERSLQQLVNTELWARNRQIGKLEQQRYVTQVQAQKERRSAAIVPQQPATKGILVRKSPPQSPPVKERTNMVAITTPPPVLPDYSEVNFFYSCDEDEDDDEDNDDDQENDTETNAMSSTEEETHSGEEPVKLSATIGAGAPLASSSPQIVRSQKRQRRRQRPKNDAAVSSSTESISVTVGDLSSGATTASPTPSRRRRRIMGGGAGSHRRRRCRSLRCSTADAQVQCDGTGTENGDDQAGLLRRELDARRRENCRLYDMLLRLQRDRGSKTAAPPKDGATAASPSDDEEGSPEPYGRAARAVRGRIADLLPPLLRPSTNGSATSPPRDLQTDENSEQALLRLQQQQQLLLVARLRERIVAYERQELLGGGDRVESSASLAADRDNAVEHMDRAALVNVALPRAVDRLRSALVPLLQHKQSPSMETSRAERDSSVG